jgi:hypothetical protein
MQYIVDNPMYEWDWFYISRNPNIKMTDVLNNLELNLYDQNCKVYKIVTTWDWDELSINPSITAADIIQNQYITIRGKTHLVPWDWYVVSRKPDLPIDFVFNNLKLPWNWDGIAVNPYLFSGSFPEERVHEIRQDYMKLDVVSMNLFHMDERLSKKNRSTCK